MKYLLLFISITGLLACQSAYELQSASTKGLANSYSCGQINAAFSAYEADKTSFMALKEIAVVSGLEIKPTAATEASSYYESAKAAANIALIVQGCPPRD
tara:strand:+ start:1382 stop:1681 length:300 start_codon:yes stop_codon:yes gene_type:complete